MKPKGFNLSKHHVVQEGKQFFDKLHLHYPDGIQFAESSGLQNGLITILQRNKTLHLHLKIKKALSQLFET